MFALKENIIPHFELMSSVDHGSDINWKVWACESIVKKGYGKYSFSDQCQRSKDFEGRRVQHGAGCRRFSPCILSRPALCTT